jgi:fructokinase
MEEPMRQFKNTLVFVSILLLFPFLSLSNTTTNKKYDVVSIGKAMVDLIQYVSEEELLKIMPSGFKKSDTTKIDNNEANNIIAKMKNITIIPGGSEANVMVNISSLGGKTAFNTIAANDKFGILFKESLEKEGVDYLSPFTKDNKLNTARCITFITPDKDRTFAVSADIAKEINDKFVNYDSIINSKVFYTDASNLSPGGANNATHKAINLAKKHNTIVAFNLNNNHYVKTYRDDIIKLLPNINIIIGSENEALNLFKMSDLNEVIKKYLEHSQIVIITQGKEGAIIATNENIIHVPSVVDQAKIIDLNGAGDAFAAGFLYGYTHGYTLMESGKIAAKTSAQLIYQTGARPSKKLKNEVLGL